MGTPLNYAYLAGLLDGEGCYTLSFNLHKSKKLTGHPNTTPIFQIYIGMNETPQVKELFQNLKNIFAGCFGYVRSRSGKSHCRWTSGDHKKALDFLKKIQPFSIVKNRQIELLIQGIELWATRTRKSDTAELLIKLAEFGDEIASYHSHQIPRKWNSAYVKSMIALGYYYQAPIYTGRKPKVWIPKPRKIRVFPPNAMGWSKNYAHCIKCKRSDRRYGAKGLCNACNNCKAKSEKRKLIRSEQLASVPPML
jgi:hypothetical protein